MSIGSRIKERRVELNLTQPALAELLGVSKGTIGNYECDISAPNEKILFKLFEALKCDANFLYQDNLTYTKAPIISNMELEHINKYRTLDYFGKKAVDDLLNTEYARCTPEEDEEEPEKLLQIKHCEYKVSAGHGFEFFADEEWDEIDVPDTPESRRADFALTIQGNSMEPVYYDGDIVLVRQQDAVDVGQIGIFVLNSAGYIKKNGGDRLISLNEEYDDILIEEYDDCRCVGKVIGRV